MKKRILTTALENADFPAVIAALNKNVVFHSPLLATLGDEVHGDAVVVKILQAAIACYGLPQNVEEFLQADGRYMVTFDGVITGNLIQFALLVTEDTAHQIERLRMFARPWPIVKLFRENLEHNLRPDPLPAALWVLPVTA